MTTDVSSRDYGPYFYELSLPERLAVIRYITKLAKHYPELAAQATAGPGNDGVVYVYAALPEEDELLIPLQKVAVRITSKILLDTGISILLMPDVK